MTRRYVIAGNGIAGQTCAEELRRSDPDCSITIVAAEPHPLYNRVALPRYLRGQLRREKVFLRTVEDSAERGIEIRFSTRVVKVDAAAHEAHTDRGEVLGYDALLVATGGRPVPPPWPGAAELPRVHEFQTIDDTDAIVQCSQEVDSFLVLGGSFIAYELAEAMVMRGKRVTWLMRGPRFLRKILDEDGGALCTRLGMEQGVEFIYNDEVEGFHQVNGRVCARTAGGRTVEFDALCYGAGLDYFIEPLVGTGAVLRKGIVTDDRLRTNLPDVYAAGDVAIFHDRMLGRHNQMGTWDNAEAHGRTAAVNMAGGDEAFFDVPTYTTTMFKSTLAVMGITPDVDPTLESVKTFSLAEGYFRKLFFKDDRLVGAVMIGPPKGRKKLIEIMRARQPINRPREELLDPGNL